MGAPYLAEVLSYPVKSLGGGGHQRSRVHPWGVAQDRRWMVVDQAGRFMTQRECARMALLHAGVHGAMLMLTMRGTAPLLVATGAGGGTVEVTIWNERVEASDCGQQVAAWLSAALGVSCRLVHLARSDARPLRQDFAQGQAECVSLADGFPVLLVSRSSLDDLNARLAVPVPMARFRPNLVIAGPPAWAEDTWRRVRIGEVVFRVAKPCDRCIITTIDQQTGRQEHGNEPLMTLGKFRRDVSGRIMFGQNLVPEICGDLRIGEAVEVLETGPPNVTIRAGDG